MIDQEAIANFERTYLGDCHVQFCFGNTTIVAFEWQDEDGYTNLRPVSGDQVACGEWYDLEEDEVAAYCELIEDELIRRENNEND